MKIYYYTSREGQGFYIRDNKCKVYHLPFGRGSVSVFPWIGSLPSLPMTESTPLAFLIMTGFEIDKIMANDVVKNLTCPAYKFFCRDRNGEVKYD
jgi:hypothetical protein